MQLPLDHLGKEVALGTFTVTAADIRVFAEGVGDLHPLYLDPEYARQAGYPDVIAPPTFCLRLRGGRMSPELPLAPGLVGLNAGQELELYDEICAGRTYTVTARIAEMYEKTGRSGPLGVIVREVTVTDAGGKAVVVLREREMIRSQEKKI